MSQRPKCHRSVFMSKRNASENGTVMADFKQDTRLVTLERKRPENYFEGFKEIGVKKKMKRKLRNQSPTEQKKVFASDPESHLSSREDWNSVLKEDGPEEKKCHTVEENIEFNRALVKMKCYERMKSQQEEVSFRKQTHQEDTFMEDQENLIETWLDVMKRHKEIMDNSFAHFLPRRRSSCKRSKIVVSLLRKKFWKNEEENESSLSKQVNLMEESEKSENHKEENVKGIANGSAVNDILGDFSSKLIFVDFEESD